MELYNYSLDMKYGQDLSTNQPTAAHQYVSHHYGEGREGGGDIPPPNASKFLWNLDTSPELYCTLLC